MQTKFSALIPRLLTDIETFPNKTDIFWHSFFLLKPEFHTMQTALYHNYSIESLRFIISRCLSVISDQKNDKVVEIQKKNASFLLIQIFESIWPRIREGTFGVDAINILCGLDKSQEFFDNLMESIFKNKFAEPALVLISLLVATRDIETNSLTDFFINESEMIIQYCLNASDLHILLLSLLLQLERPTGPFVSKFKEKNPKIFNSLVANLMARCSQMYLCCHSEPKTNISSFFKKPLKKQTAVIGFYDPVDYQLPLNFALFEPFIDSAVLNFYELCISGPESYLVCEALNLFINVITNSNTLHYEERVRMFLVCFMFLFDKHPEILNCECESMVQYGLVSQETFTPRSIGAVSIDIFCYLMKGVTNQDLSFIGRIIFNILQQFYISRQTDNVNWDLLYSTLFQTCRNKCAEKIDFNGYVIAIVAMTVTYKAALFKRDNGYIAMIRAIMSQSAIVGCLFSEPADIPLSVNFIKKCVAFVEELYGCYLKSVNNNVGIIESMNDEQLYQHANNLKITPIPTANFPKLEHITEKPKFTSFFRIYERMHCENTQVFLHYAASHN